MRRTKRDIPTTKESFIKVIKLIWKFLENDKKKYIGLIVILTVLYFYYLIPPIILGKSVDFFTKFKQGDDYTYFIYLCLILGVTSFIAATIRIAVKGSLSRIIATARYRTKVQGFERLVDFSLKWHQEENSGNKVQRIITGSKSVESAFRLFGSTILVTLVTFIGTAVYSIFVNPYFIIFYLVYFFLMVWVEIHFDKRLTTLMDQFNTQQESASGSFIEGATNMLAIKALGAKHTMSKRVEEREGAAKDLSFKKIKISNHKWLCFQLINAASWAIFLFMTGYEVVQGKISPGTILIYASYFFNLRDRITDFAESINDALEIHSDIAHMLPVFSENDEFMNGTKNFPEVWSDISITNLNFAYNESKSTLNNVSFVIKKGEKIGIAGSSGSGKSTLVKILLGLYKPTSGVIRVGSENYYDISHDEITKNIAIVLQETELFNVSLQENITLMKEVDIAILEKAIRIACLEDVIKKLPEGLQALVGEKGYALSGGERQRLGIARAICKNPQIILLDEATSALDTQTEKAVMKGILGDYGDDKTMIVIAHRLSTIEYTDKVIVMENGSIVETGKFKELNTNPDSKFYHLSNTTI